MQFYILLYIFSVFLPTLDENAIIYILALYKIYGNVCNVKLLNLMRIAHKEQTDVYVARIKQIVKNMLYEMVRADGILRLFW